MEKLKLFSHLLYECKKGVRSAALCTIQADCCQVAISKLKSNNMAYHICPLSNGQANLFFGEPVCMNVVRKICDKPLNLLSPEDDFMLVAILGYGICEQCKRYSKMNKKLAI